MRAGKREQVPVRLIALRLPEEVIRRRKQRAKREVERRPRSKGVQRCGRRPKRGPGRQPRQRAKKRHKVSASKQRQLEWLLVLTNVDGRMLSARQVVALMRLRWQIELFWKLWKQEGKIDTWRSSKPQRILTELYAKLLGLLLEHWVTLEGCWADPRRSLFKAQASAPVDRALAGSGHSRRGGLGGGALGDVLLDGIQLLDRQAATLAQYLPATGRSKALRFLA